MIFDRYARPLLNLRVSVIDSCNLECIYCHREGYCHIGGVMSGGELLQLVEVASELGVRYVKLTGGEPLLRRDLPALISGISDLRGIREISMVSNARLLDYETAKVLKDAGLSRINIGIPSIRDETYYRVTGARLLDAVRGLENAVRVGLNPVKLNMVLLRGINEVEIWDAVRFAQERSVILQLIELEPIGLPDETYRLYHFPLDDIVERLEGLAKSVRVREFMHGRRIYSLDGVEVEVVKPIENTEFCLHCTRLRLTHDGKLKPCLMRNDNLVDVLTPLRMGASKDELKTLFLQAVSARRPYWSGANPASEV
ncbi:MAG: GTP 3',8-cyclase MoaA [Candidatus Bathyarchaeia archaeon]